LSKAIFSCCGVENTSPFSLYQHTPWYQASKTLKVPMSCCIKLHGEVYENLNLCLTGNANSIYKHGCMPAVTKLLVDKYLILLGIIIALAVVLILGMALSLAHLRNIINIRYHQYSHPIWCCLKSMFVCVCLFVYQKSQYLVQSYCCLLHRILIVLWLFFFISNLSIEIFCNFDTCKIWFVYTFRLHVFLW